MVNIKNWIKQIIVKKNIQDFQWSFVGIFFASSIMFLVHTISGRVLGPEQYGEAAFIISAASVLHIFFIGGIDVALTKVLAKSKRQSQKIVLISSGFLLMIVLFIFFGIVFWIALSLWKQLDYSYKLNVTIAFALIIFFGIKFFFEGVSRGLSLFKKQAIARLLEAVSTFFVVVIGIFYSFYFSYVHYILVIIIGCVIAIFFYIMIFKKYLKLSSAHLQSSKLIIRSGLLFAYSAFISAFVTLSDKFVINYYLGREVLGIYFAYTFTSIMIAGLIATIINNALFVHSARHNNKYIFIEKIDSIFKKGFSFLFSFLFLFNAGTILLLYGDKFELNISYLILFSFLGCLTLFNSLYTSIITTGSNYMFLRTILLFTLRIIFLCIYYYVLINNNLISIQLILVGLICDYIFAITIVRYVAKKYKLK